MSEQPCNSNGLRPLAHTLHRVVVRGLALTVFSFLAVANARAATDINGHAYVVDGDTIEVAGERVRLEGIDAPEMGQSCNHRWLGTWNCGQEARRVLATLVEGRVVTCTVAAYDRYERALGLCRADGRDINAELVSRGLAWAFVRFSDRYVTQENAARLQKVGIWQADTAPAWDFRARKWAHAEQQAPKGCAIKGNVSQSGSIYHMPWSPWYQKVKVEVTKGEHWFCSEADAARAGFRPAVQH